MLGGGGGGGGRGGERRGGRGEWYLWLAVLLQPGDDAGGEGVEGGHTDGRVEGLEQLVRDALELQGGGASMSLRRWAGPA